VLGEVTQQQLRFTSLDGDIGLQLQQLADQQSLSSIEAAGISDPVQPEIAASSSPVSVGDLVQQVESTDASALITDDSVRRTVDLESAGVVSNSGMSSR